MPVSASRIVRACSHSASGDASAPRQRWVRTVGIGEPGVEVGHVGVRRSLPAREGGTAPRSAIRRVGRRVRLLQHKTEAYWFYRFLSLVYDRWVNPLFWTEAMREVALDAAGLGERGLRTLDCGAGTGFTTEGIVARVDPANVTMIDQSPHQLARARAKPALAGVEKLEGDAEALPFGDDAFDRYVSAGSIEYWPDPQRGVAEAYRVLREGGRATVIGPVRPGQPAAAGDGRRLDALPGRGGVPGVDGARRLRGRRARAARARLVPQPQGAVRGRRRGREARAGRRRRARAPRRPPSARGRR